MGILLYRQSLTALAALAPAQVGAPINQIDFQISPAENLEVSDWNEDASDRFSIDGNVTQVMGMGSVALASVLVLQPSADLQVQLTNGLGQSQLLTFKGGRTSILHVDFTAITFKNPSLTVAVTGKYFLAGV